MKQKNSLTPLAFSTAETCQMLGFSKDLLYRLIKEKRIKAMHISRTCFRISRSAIEDFLNSFKAGATDEEKHQ